MKKRFVRKWVIGTCSLLIVLGSAQAQIHVDSARIGCLDIQKDGNLTGLVASACNGKSYCAYKAPTEDEYKRAGVHAQTRFMCTQAMEITYRCRNDQIIVTVDGDAWNNHPGELTCEPLQPPPTPEPQGAKLKGWVDLHTHPLSNLGFGGKLVYGGVDIGALLPADPDCHKNVRAGSVDQALGHDGSTHGGNNYTPSALIKTQCGDEIRKLVIHALQGDFTGDIIEVAKGHAFTVSENALGAPDFTDWPLWNDITHQKMWVDWIRRAYNSGLRVLVALAVNNKTLADATAGPGDYPTDDRSSADLQIAHTIAFVGRHPDFMEVAYSSADLERIVRANKLAVVLGVEIDNIGNLKGTPSNTEITAEIDHLYKEGVRYVFPIHLLDNPFGGTATYQDEFNFSTYREDGHYWDLACPDPHNPPPASEAINYKFSNLNGLLPPLLEVAAPKLHNLFPPLPIYPNCGVTNNRGLTPQGEFAIRWMMKRGMLIDIDHMSDKSKNRTLEIAESMTGQQGVKGYPVNSGHSGLRGYFADPNNRGINERSTTLKQYQRIALLHGMVGIGSAGLTAFEWADMYRHVLAAMGTDIGTNSGIAGFGTDLNGVEKGMPPDAEQDGAAPNPPYVACMEKFECDRSVGDNVRRPWGTAASSAAASCIAKAKASCDKQFPPTISRCLINCGIEPVDYKSFPISCLGTRNFNYNFLGVAHYGMLADFIQDVKNQDKRAGRNSLIDNNLMNGADYFLETWKKIDLFKDRQMVASAAPESVRPGVATTIVVHVTDNETHTPVPNAVVHVGSQTLPAGQPFQHVFQCHEPQSNPGTRVLGPKPVTEPPDFSNPTFPVSAPGYMDSFVEFLVAGVQPRGMICH